MTDSDTDPVAGQIVALTSELKLPTVRRLYHRLAREVALQGGDYEAYLLAILQEEVTERKRGRVERHIKEARFPQVKLLGDLDWRATPMPPQAQVMSLAEGDYIRQGHNVIVLGNSGTGKTHLATGLGIAACQRGLRVRFYTAVTLASELEEAKEQHQLHRYLARFARWDLVILDELGYLPLGKAGGELLFQAVSVRHEHGSLALTTNLPFESWTEVFHSERLTASLLDRLTDQATILVMNGPSYRLQRTLAASGTGDPTVEA